ncbi:MAG: LexA family protein [Fimbriimonadaceae bacterium]
MKLESHSGEAIRMLREEGCPIRLSRLDLAKLLEPASPEAMAARLGTYESGKIRPPAELVREIEQIVKRIKLALGSGDSLQPPVTAPKYPVTYDPLPLPTQGSSRAGNWDDPLASDDLVEIEARFFGARRFVTAIVGDSCWPALLPGDLAVWQLEDRPNPGAIVLARQETLDLTTVKKLEFNPETGEPRLVPVNPKFDPVPNDLEWRILAKLVGVERKVGGLVRSWYTGSGLRPADLMAC